MSGKELSSVAYKKGNWMRYTLWAFATICIIILGVTFVSAMNGEISSSVPDDYRFSITDNYSPGSKSRTTYYIYDDKILVEDESVIDGEVNRSVMIYDGFNTTAIKYDQETAELCELGACEEKPRALITIKHLLSRHIGREYIRL